MLLLISLSIILRANIYHYSLLLFLLPLLIRFRMLIISQFHMTKNNTFNFKEIHYEFRTF